MKLPSVAHLLSSFLILSAAWGGDDEAGEIAQQAYLKASSTVESDVFGNSVAVSGDTVVVGVPGDDSVATGIDGAQTNLRATSSGAAYVFVREGGFWKQRAYLKASNTGSLDQFGASVAVSGDTVVIGAPGEGSAATGVNGDQSNDSARSSGAAYVFVREGTTWTQQAYLKASNTNGFDNFGCSVAVSDDTIVIGAENEASGADGIDGDQANNNVGRAGAAYVFRREGTTWTQSAYLKASRSGINDRFGSSVAVAGDTVVVGAYLEESGATGVDGDQADNSENNSGAAYVFVRDGATWSQQAYLKASNTESDDQFGWSVAVSGDTVVIGARQEASAAQGVDGDQSDNSAPTSGAVYVFVRDGTTWRQQAYLKASNAASDDEFGESVAVSGDTVIVGAAYEDSAAKGIGGDQTDDGATDSGAAYVFVRDGAKWRQQAYLKASNTGVFDRFGYAVAVSGATVVVGAPVEDSPATGVDGDQTNTSSAGASASGATYVFDLDSIPSQEIAVARPLGAGLNSGTSTVDFNMHCVGFDRDPKTLVIRNDGTLPLTGLSASLTGAAAGEFTLDDSDLGPSLQPGESASVSVSYSPSLRDALSAASLQITSNDADENPFTVGLVGATPLQMAQQAYLKASNTGNSDGFGYSVAVSGDTVVVGAYREDSAAAGVNNDQADDGAAESGAVYVFVRDGTTWNQQAYLKASNSGAGDRFGASVAISGDTLAVGAHLEDSAATGIDGDGSDNGASNSGAAYVFVRDGATWSQKAYLKASNTGGGDEFGSWVAVTDDTVVVGADLEDSAATGIDGDGADETAEDSGAAYVFVRDGTTWNQQAYLKASNTGAGDNFGQAVAISGDTLVAGADREASGATGIDGDQSDDSEPRSGAAYVFVRDGATWSQQAYLKASNCEHGDMFAQSVSVSGETLVVGAPLESGGSREINGNQLNHRFTREAGAAYVFVREGATWRQEAYLNGSYTVAGDNFGSSVAVAADTVVVGAMGDDVISTGVSCIPVMRAADSGAAYVFQRASGRWSQRGYIKASNTGSGDAFGIWVAVSGETVAVGAPFEDSAATGVNGTGANNSASSSGAAYVLDLDAPYAIDGFQAALATAGLTGAETAPHATPHGDGIANLIKYAFGMDLAGPDTSRTTPGSGTPGLPAITLTDNGGGKFLRIEYLRRIGSGLIYTPKKSPDLSDLSWTSLTSTAEVTPIDANWERVVYEEPLREPCPEKYFGTVEITLPDESDAL